MASSASIAPCLLLCSNERKFRVLLQNTLCGAPPLWRPQISQLDSRLKELDEERAELQQYQVGACSTKWAPGVRSGYSHYSVRTRSTLLYMGALRAAALLL